MDKYCWTYKTPEAFTDMIMYSDGRFLTGLVFERSADGFRNRWDDLKRAKRDPKPVTQRSSDQKVAAAPGTIAGSDAVTVQDAIAVSNNAAVSIAADDIHTPFCETERRLLPVFEDTVLWLDQYFGKDPDTGLFTAESKWPDFVPAMRIEGLTPFRRKVITTMISIPFGQTMTYGEIAKAIGKEKMSARAVGGAVGWNPICLIIPCHRVLGTNGYITGYGGGINNKIALLQLEGIML